MSKKVISFGLSESEIDSAIKELESYKQDILRKCDILRERIADKIAEYARRGFDSSVVDDLTKESGGARKANVSVSVENGDNISVIIATGEDAVWCEFGAGIFHNGSVGSTPNPYSNNVGFAIGTYGKGNGAKKSWGFYENGELKITHGTPASMPMYNVVQAVAQEVEQIAREVFR